MAQASFIQGGLDRVESAFKTFEKDFRRLQKRADQRRKQLEKRAEREVRRFQTELRKNPVVKRAQTLGEDARKAASEQVDALLGTLRLASRTEVERLDRKVGQLNRKVRELEKAADSGKSRAA